MATHLLNSILPQATSWLVANDNIKGEEESPKTESDSSFDTIFFASETKADQPPSNSIMPTIIKKYKAAAVTAEPGWFDLEKSVQKTIHWINEAGAAGCKLVAFPEVCRYFCLINRCLQGEFAGGEGFDTFECPISTTKYTRLPLRHRHVQSL